MIRATFIIYGDVQKSHYRGRVIRIAQKMGITGTIQNLVNGTVKIVAEGHDRDIELFRREIDIKNYLIDVSKIERLKEKDIEIEEREYEDFYKLVSEGETDERLDRAAELLKDVAVGMKTGFARMDSFVMRMYEHNSRMDSFITRMDEYNSRLEKILEKLSEK